MGDVQRGLSDRIERLLRARRIALSALTDFERWLMAERPTDSDGRDLVSSSDIEFLKRTARDAIDAIGAEP